MGRVDKAKDTATYTFVIQGQHRQQVVQPLKNFPSLYENQKVHYLFTRTLHWSLSRATPIQFIPYHPITKIYLNVI
jgi:hypothetical protein